MKITFLGADHEVTGSLTYLEAGGHRILVDCGMEQGKDIFVNQSLPIGADQVDAVFTPTDNTIMAAELGIYEFFRDAKIPHFTGADSFALNGAFLGYGVDYANLGRETANMVADILLNGKDPAEVPVMTFDNGTATVNNEIIAALDLTFEQVEALFAPYCTKVAAIDTAEEFE